MNLNELISKNCKKPICDCSKDLCLYRFCEVGRASDNKDCLVCEENKWMTFYYERGRKLKLKTYDNETEACAAFWDCMMEVKELILK